MLDGPELERAIAAILKRLQGVNTLYIKKVAAQIKRIGEMNPSSVSRLVAMADMGADVNEITEQLRLAARLNVRDLQKVFQQALDETYQDPRFKLYFDENPDALRPEAEQRITRFATAVYQQTAAAMYNLSNTTAVSLGYRNAIDRAVLATATGLGSYTETMRDVVKSLGANGLQTVYASGYKRRLDTAVRQNIVDGVRQVNMQASMMVGEELGFDAVEISAHRRSAPDHEPVQGRVFLKEDFELMQSGQAFRDVDGHLYQGFKRPITQWNCQHIPLSFSTKYSKHAYTDEQLRRWADENQRGCIINGKHKTLYEASQIMRNLETEVRRQKDTAVAAQAAGDDALRKVCQQNINALVRRYAAVAKASGNDEKRNRMTVEGFRAVKV